MSILSEDGTGVAGAEMYNNIAWIDAYWTARPHDEMATAWSGATDAVKEGAAREGCNHLDATYGSFYLGSRKDYAQGREWPRNGAADAADEDSDGDTTEYLPVRDKDGVDLPALPNQLLVAQAELAARAIGGRLAEDLERGGRVKTETLSGVVSTTYEDGAPTATSFGVIDRLLGPILNGSQPGSSGGSWEWR